METQESTKRTYSRRSLHGQVAYELGMRIVGGGLQPGDILPNESDLCIELQVSRSALREAVKMLAAKGLVETRPKTGTRVQPKDHWNLLDPDVLSWIFDSGSAGKYLEDLFEIRLIIEPPAAAIAARRADAETLQALEKAYLDMEKAGNDVEAGVEPDLRFHQGILKATGNALLVPLGALIETALATSFTLSSSSPTARTFSLPRHKAVLDAIMAGDESGAETAMHKLLGDTVSDLRRMITKDGATSLKGPVRPAT